MMVAMMSTKSPISNHAKQVQKVSMSNPWSKIFTNGMGYNIKGLV
jgi:hypothetical protein